MTGSNSKHYDILEFIEATRNSFVGAEHVYTHGSCYHFAKMLEAAFPGGAIYEDTDHAYYTLDDKSYDITGQTYPRYNEKLAREPTRHKKFNLFEHYDKVLRRVK